MLPDIPQNSVSFVSPLYRNPQRGDLVLLKSNAKEEHKFYHKIWHALSSFFTAFQYDSYVNKEYPGTNNQIRRIIALPGDEIYMRDYVLYIKPANQKHSLTEFELSDKSYNLTFVTPPSDWNGSVGVKASFDAFTLGPDEYFVLGDNRVSVADSRLWGPLTKAEIKGRVILMYFPFQSFKLF